MKSKYILAFVMFTLSISTSLCENKYSKSANEKQKTPDVNFRTLEKPFRMNKLNILWKKAQQRLTEPKLKSLYSDLMIQDKEEINLKRVKSESGDKEGMREAELRRKLTEIMNYYNLREHFDDNVVRNKDPIDYISDAAINKSMFKDKKLNQLWAKAEMSGFTSEELAALKEEFMHHQDKIEQYYELLNDVEGGKKDGYKNAVNEEELDTFNEINYDPLQTNEINKDYLHTANLVRDKHRGLRDGYDRLHRIAAKGPNNREFIEPKVQGLWKVAAAGNFTADEMESLKVELQHYESRLLKLRHLHAQHVSNVESRPSKIAATGDKMDYFDEQQQMIKKHSLKVDKMHKDLESRIMSRHTDL